MTSLGQKLLNSYNAIKDKVTRPTLYPISQVSNFIRQNPTPMGFIGRQFQSQIQSFQQTAPKIFPAIQKQAMKTPIMPFIPQVTPQKLSTFQAPLEQTTQNLMAKLPQRLQQPVSNAFPITQVPSLVGEQVRQVGRVAGLQPNKMDLVMGGLMAVGGIKNIREGIKFPTQKKSGWCGPTALQYALKEQGIDVSQEALAKKMSVNPKNGANPGQIRFAAEKAGMKVNTIENQNPQLTLSLLDQAKAQGKSIILDFLDGKTPNDGHYVVYQGRSNGKITVLDPQTGKPRLIDENYFINQWKDYTIKGNIFKRWAMVLDKGEAGKVNAGIPKSVKQLPQSQAKISSVKSPLLGSIDNGLPPNNSLPNIISPVGKMRGFTTSVQEAPKVFSQVKGQVTGTYQVKPDKQLMGEAQALLQEGAKLDFTKVENVDQKVVATIQEAINQQKKNPELAANLFNNLSEQGTELGRGVHAFSLLNKMSPEAIALSAAGKIKAYNRTATRKIPELNGEQVKMIGSKVDAIRKLADGREKNIAINELSNIINNFIPSSIADKAITVWKAGLLTSLRTHERNLLGNTIMYGSEMAKDIPATGADWLMSKATGQRSMTPTLQGTLTGAKKGVIAMKDVITRGYDPEEAISKFDVHRITWGKNPVEQFLKKATDAVYRPLAGEDKVFWHSSYARSLYDQAGAQAINAGKQGNRLFIDSLVHNPTAEMAKNALNDANYATFHDKSVLSTVASGIKRAAKSIPGLGGEAGKVVTEVLAPFTGVPSSIVGKTIAYSPIGLVKGAINVGRVMVGQVPELQRQAAQEIGRGMVGTGLFGLGAYLMSKGLMTGQPKDATEAALWQTQNKPSNSVLWFDGKWKNIGSIGPQNLVVLAGAKYQEEMGKPSGGDISAYAGGLAKDQLSQTFLQGVQQPIAAINDPARYGKSYLGNQASSVIPNIVKDASKAFDPNARELNTSLDYVKQSIPGVRNTMLPKRDVLGNVVPQEPTGINAFFDLFNSKTPIDNQVINELDRLYQTGNEAMPSKLSSSQTVLKQKVKLTFEQLNNLEAGVGEVLRPQLQTLIASPVYQQLSDENKANAIDKIVKDVRLKYKNIYANDILSGQSATGNSQEDTTNMETSTINTSDIFDYVDEDGNYKTIKLPKDSKLIKLDNGKMIADSPIGRTFYYKNENGNYATIEIDKDVPLPNYTGNTEVDKILKSQYKTDLNKKAKDAILAYQQGFIMLDELNKIMNTTTKIKNSLSAGKKPTKTISDAQLLSAYKKALEAASSPAPKRNVKSISGIIKPVQLKHQVVKPLR